MNMPLLYEEKLYQSGFDWVAGTDESGRGPLAGPVFAAAVILPKGLVIEGVDDSKKLSPKKRLAMADIIREKAIAYGIGFVNTETIDRINILQATFIAMQRAVLALRVQPGALLIDGIQKPVFPPSIHCVCLPYGDTLSQSIAAASILAKTARDKVMLQIHEKYPLYGFNHNKGYGTVAHIKAIQAYGLCPEHRRSFKVRRFYEN